MKPFLKKKTDIYREFQTLIMIKTMKECHIHKPYARQCQMDLVLTVACLDQC